MCVEISGRNRQKPGISVAPWEGTGVAVGQGWKDTNFLLFILLYIFNFLPCTLVIYLKIILKK